MYLALRPSRGLISLFARNAASYTTDELPAVRRQIGVVFQNFRLIDHLSTFDNVALPLRVSGAAESMIQKHVELLGWVGLADHLNPARQHSPAVNNSAWQLHALLLPSPAVARR